MNNNVRPALGALLASLVPMPAALSGTVVVNFAGQASAAIVVGEGTRNCWYCFRAQRGAVRDGPE
jgi:hypothetical protein